MRGKPQYRELKLQGCEAQQAAEAAAYAKSWEDSVVLDIFSWQLQSTMTCCSCGKRSHAFDSSQELLAAIPTGSGDNVTLQVRGQGVDGWMAAEIYDAAGRADRALLLVVHCAACVVRHLEALGCGEPQPGGQTPCLQQD